VQRTNVRAQLPYFRDEHEAAKPRSEENRTLVFGSPHRGLGQDAHCPIWVFRTWMYEREAAKPRSEENRILVFGSPHRGLGQDAQCPIL